MVVEGVEDPDVDAVGFQILEGLKKTGVLEASFESDESNSFEGEWNGNDCNHSSIDLLE